MASDEHGEESPDNDSPVIAALGLEEAALEEILAWARSRSQDLLRTLEDRELLALLEPSEARSTQERRTLESPPQAPETPPELAAPTRSSAPPPQAHAIQPKPEIRAGSVAPPPPRSPSPERREATPRSEGPATSGTSEPPQLQMKAPGAKGWAKAYPWLRGPPAMGPTQVHPQAPMPPSSAEPATTKAPARPHATLKLGTLVEPEDLAEDLVDGTELDEVELPEVDWAREPDAPDRDAPAPRQSHARESYHDVAHQSSPDRQTSGRERRTAPRYSLTEPAVIEIRNWSELVTLYVRDISSGGLFVGTSAPPAPGVEVTVQLLLPDEAGTLDFDGRVVRVVTPDQAAGSGKIPGFGIQFLGLTPERRRALERLIEQAKQTTLSPGAESPRLSTLGLSGNPGPAGGLRLTLSESERQQMQQLRAELEAMSERGDLELLGLSESGTFEQLRAAFERLAQRWHPDVTHRDAPPEIRALATEVFLRIERAYRRLSDLSAPPPPPPSAPPPSSGAASASPSASAPGADAFPNPPAYAADGPRPETVIGPVPTAPRKPRRRPILRDDPPPQPPRNSASQAQRMVSDLLDRGDELTHRLKRRGQRALSEEERQDRVDEALDMISAKRYREAGRLLMKVIRDRPELRLRVLLSVVNARQAITDRDYARARNCYQAVLQLDPNNALAKRELLLLEGLEEG